MLLFSSGEKIAVNKGYMDFEERYFPGSPNGCEAAVWGVLSPSPPTLRVADPSHQGRGKVNRRADLKVGPYELKSPRPSGTPLQKGGKAVPLTKGELKGDSTMDLSPLSS